MSMTDELLARLERLGRPRILVVGDIMLDRYTWGNAQRVSPEAPILVLQAQECEVRLGGGASVSSLLRGLDADVSLAGVVGDDASGRLVRKLLADAAIDHQLVIEDPDRPTTSKERFMGRAANRHPHQILRVDHEVADPLSEQLQQRLLSGIVSRLPDYEALLISDYHKGVCSAPLVKQIITRACEKGMPVVVDPARIRNYERYRRTTVLTPNRIEAELATGQKVRTSDDALTAGQMLRDRFDLQAVLVTLDSEGMVLIQARETGEHFPTQPREVYDITGAGDMVLAMAGVCQAAEIPLPASIPLLNAAAGLEVEKLGVVPVSRAEIGRDVRRAGLKRDSKLVTLDEMSALAKSYRQNAQTVVLTNGCFDLLHVGHATHLEQAAELGDVLVVAVNSDSSVRSLKGPTRPLISQSDRAAMLAALGCVDHVLIFDDLTPVDLLRRIRPDVLVKGGNYRPDQVVGGDVVDAYGGEVRVTGKVPGLSTTEIVSNIRGTL